MPDRYRAFVLTAAYSSLRWSELVALRVDRLDLVRDVIRVEEKIVESGRLIQGAPKTERSRRAVTLPHTITLALAEHVRRYPPGEDGLVFTAERGGVIRRPAFGRLVWRPALAHAGLLDRLVATVRKAGYQRVRLDSPDFMTAAHGLHRSSGFMDIEPYPESEIPDEYKSHWIFMEKGLT